MPVMIDIFYFIRENKEGCLRLKKIFCFLKKTATLAIAKNYSVETERPFSIA